VVVVVDGVPALDGDLVVAADGMIRHRRTLGLGRSLPRQQSRRGGLASGLVWQAEPRLGIWRGTWASATKTETVSAEVHFGGMMTIWEDLGVAPPGALDGGQPRTLVSDMKAQVLGQQLGVECTGN